MIPTSNYSSRFGERVRLLALHDTEGARDVYSLGAYFQRINNASYHGAVDDNTYQSYVNYSDAAWHILNANQESDGLALCGFAAWTRDEWLRHPRMLDLASAWLAERSKARNIPLVHLNAKEIRDCMANRSHPGGVIMHKDYTLATSDGTHTDLGYNFPIEDVLAKARSILNSARPQRNDEDGMELPPTYTRKDFQIPAGVEGKLLLIANTDGNKGSTRVWGIYAVVDKGPITPPAVSTMFEAKDRDNGHSFPQWWPFNQYLPSGTTSVIVNYLSPVGMVGRIN